MTNFELYFPEINYRFPMIYVEGTYGVPYLFNEEKEIHIKDFFISQFQITQVLWEYIMGTNPSFFKGDNRPVEKVSYNSIVKKDGFLEKLNENEALKKIQSTSSLFRLPTETEWEYAARGGQNWTDGFTFSGSNDLNEVGWYELNSGKYSDPAIIARLKNHEKGTETHEVGLKAPNQLGIYDMSGNLWEWCQDYFLRDLTHIPEDGTACLIPSEDRVLRGGCHHNWSVHCTVSKRYEIMPEFADECIGFRVVISA